MGLRYDGVIISKDNDFLARALTYGHPPKVIMVAVGNIKTRELITFLRASASAIHGFADSAEESALVLRRPRE